MATAVAQEWFVIQVMVEKDNRTITGYLWSTLMSLSRVLFKSAADVIFSQLKDLSRELSTEVSKNSFNERLIQVSKSVKCWFLRRKFGRCVGMSGHLRQETIIKLQPFQIENTCCTYSSDIKSERKSFSCSRS